MNGKHVMTNVQHVPIKGAAYMMSLYECNGYNPKSRRIQRISVFLFKDQVATLRTIPFSTKPMKPTRSSERSQEPTGSDGKR